MIGASREQFSGRPCLNDLRSGLKLLTLRRAPITSNHGRGFRNGALFLPGSDIGYIQRPTFPFLSLPFFACIQSSSTVQRFSPAQTSSPLISLRCRGLVGGTGIAFLSRLSTPALNQAFSPFRDALISFRHDYIRCSTPSLAWRSPPIVSNISNFRCAFIS